MTKEELLQQAIEKLRKLPEAKLEEANNYIAFLVAQLEDQVTTQGIHKMADQGHSYHFVLEDEDLYSVEDLKEVYHAKR